MPQAWSRLENRPLSRRMHREKCRPPVRLASGAPVFANGAVTAAMAYAFNQMVSEGFERHKASATQEGRSLAEPHLSHWDGVEGAHRYENGATLLCALASEGCSGGIMEQLFGPISAPFAEPYTGPGRSYTLLGINPIHQESLGSGVFLNRTLSGHRFHSGDVVHVIYEHRGGVWLYTQGRGVGGRSFSVGSMHISENAILGRMLFQQIHIQATIQADLRTGGVNGHKRWGTK
jgi:hypothetical protein